MTRAAAPARPGPICLRHVALDVEDLPACEAFYRDALGLEIAWKPDEDNVYLTNGSDNLALHRVNASGASRPQRLDHIGFVVEDERDVDRWHAHLSSLGVTIVSPPRTHRDGVRSLYCRDPDGTVVQLLHPVIGRASRTAAGGSG